ncbi:sugar transporter ERD6-like 5 [Mangifera indica]|uniref:sugar transporter ERD6-like 5 n=1 Tax=Mangifera indica TaxID=29780 RepID=UPI001CFBB6C7|nr:sugar transporter ERD6-like 5 [Mangifera indica]
MGRSQSLEEGLLPSSSMRESNQTDDGNGDGSDMGTEKFDSSATPIVVFSTIISICGFLVLGCAAGYSSPTESEIMEELGLSVAEYSVFGSALTIGGLVGATVNGKVTDLIGRRRAFWLADLFFIIGWLAIAFSQAAWSLDLGRLSLGIGIGVTFYVAPVYVAEITPKSIRGALTVANQLMLTSGTLLMYALGTVVSWRTLALIGVAPCFVQVFGIFFIPESPRWLAMVGRETELDAALQRLRGRTADISQESANIKAYTEAFQQQSEERIFNLFQPRYAHALIVGVGIMALQQLGGINAILYYASSIFEAAHFSSNVGTISLAIIQIPAVLVSVILIDKAGRRPLLMVSSTGIFLSFLLLGFSFCLQDNNYWKQITPVLVYIGIMAYIISFSIGMTGLPIVIMSEVFPINIKGSAGSLATFANSACAWAVAYTFNFMMEWSSAGTFFIYAGICGVTILFVAKLVPETKGRAIEEIQASMTLFNH